MNDRTTLAPPEIPHLPKNVPRRRQFDKDCLSRYGKLLTGDKAHWCEEFDGLPIDETCPEFEFCLCYD